MSRRKTPGSNGGDGDNGYEIGYRKPPKHSQFRPGHSGNPVGRRQGLRNLVTDVRSTLGTPVKIKEGGRTRTRSTQEGVLMVLREKALRGDARALDRFFELAGASTAMGPRSDQPRRWPPMTKPSSPPTGPKSWPPNDPGNTQIPRSDFKAGARSGKKLSNE